MSRFHHDPILRPNEEEDNVHATHCPYASAIEEVLSEAGLSADDCDDGQLDLFPETLT